MSGPITPPLTVETVDGATEGRPITTIKVSNGDLTISGNTATIDTSGSGGSPATPAKSVQFNSDPAGTFTGSAQLLYETGANLGRLEMKTGLGSIQAEIRAVDGHVLQLAGSDVTASAIKNSINLYGENDTPSGIYLNADSGATVMVNSTGLSTSGAVDLVLSTYNDEDKAKITLANGANGDILLKTEGTGSIKLSPAGTGVVEISGAYTLPTDVGTDTFVLTSDGAGASSWAAAGGGSGIGGSIADTQIAYGDSSSEITGDANFIWEASNKKLKINTPGGNPGALRVASSADNQLGASIEATMTSTTGNIDALYVKGGLKTGAHATGFGTGISFRLADTGYSGIQAARIYTERLAADADSDLKLIASGTGNISLGNFEFDADQTVGVGQDNYVLTYDHANTQISLAGVAGSAPASASATGTVGQIARDSSYFYVCVATDTWMRAEIATW